MVRTRLRRILIALAGLVVLGWALTFLGQPGLVPRLLGTGGFVPKIVSTGPHAYAFDRPRYWNDVSGQAKRAGGGALIQGPASDEGVLMTNLSISATAKGDLWPEGPITSIGDLIDRTLPPRSELIRNDTTIVDGRPARDADYDYERCEYSARPHCIQVRCRLVSFEDRGYYYLLSYEVRDAEYERYAEVFDRMVSSFRFLD